MNRRECLTMLGAVAVGAGAMGRDRRKSWLLDVREFLFPESDIVDRSKAARVVRKEINKLTERERDVLKKRFKDGLTLQAIGELHGVSGSRIRQIESRALRKLRRPGTYGNIKRGGC
jgi:RNA polymerase sigma factor (sigma-70 family)